MCCRWLRPSWGVCVTLWQNWWGSSASCQMSGNRNIGDVARPSAAQAKCLSSQRKVSSVIVMTQLSHVKTDWTLAHAKTPIIFHFLKNKFLSENHQLLVKMNMHQWYILHKYTVRGVWPWTSRKFFTPTICLMPAHSLSLNVRWDPGGASKPAVWQLQTFPGVLWAREASLPLTMEAEHPMLQSDKGGEHWLTSCSSLQLAARPTQFQNRTQSVQPQFGWPATDWCKSFEFLPRLLGSSSSQSRSRKVWRSGC